MRASSVADLAAYVEPGRITPGELREVLARTRATTAPASLSQRTYVAVSLPGAVVNRLGEDVVLGVPRGAMDDQVIRKIAARCPEVWLDGRWYPADVSGYHLLLATTITVVAATGIPQDVAALLDVPSDGRRFVHDEGTGDLQFVRLTWRRARSVASA